VKKKDVDEILEWTNERFVKSFAKLYCLALIARGYTHGYDIMKYINHQYGLKISTGSIYKVLQWLENKEYIKGSWEYKEGKPSRRNYIVTKKGVNALKAAGERLMILVNGLSN